MYQLFPQIYKTGMYCARSVELSSYCSDSRCPLDWGMLGNNAERRARPWTIFGEHHIPCTSNISFCKFWKCRLYECFFPKGRCPVCSHSFLYYIKNFDIVEFVLIRNIHEICVAKRQVNNNQSSIRFTFLLVYYDIGNLWVRLQFPILSNYMIL